MAFLLQSAQSTLLCQMEGINFSGEFVYKVQMDKTQF